MDNWDDEDNDWDEKAKKLLQKHHKSEAPSSSHRKQSGFGDFPGENDGNYASSSEKKKKELLHNKTKAPIRQQSAANEYKQPYSSKRLENIRDYIQSPEDYHKLIFSTFGELETFISTHAEVDLPDEKLVDLLNIDAALLEFHLHLHNEILLKELSKVKAFWSQLVAFTEHFLESKHKDMKFLLTVDMNGFFCNIELIMNNLLLNNLYNTEMELVFKELIKVMEKFKESEWVNPGRLSIQDAVRRDLVDADVNAIYPTLEELEANFNGDLEQNLIKGEYDNVSHYLSVQLPLLKEDFMCKLRDGIQKISSMESIDKVIKTPSVWVHPKIQILNLKRNVWGINCPIIVARLKSKREESWSKRFFVGQMLCFSTTTKFNDLIVAVVTNYNILDQQADDVSIEILRTEKIAEIYERDLYMLEPAAFFEPYHRVFNVMRTFNELNFPFKNEILKCKESGKFPSYKREEKYKYKDFKFNPENLNEWPTSEQLTLENKQLKAIQMAVTKDFSLIHGPPGTGKTFIGLEILRILLNNTNERILVLTQTNVALDNFLLGASKFTKSIARTGGQSKCKELEQFLTKVEAQEDAKKYMKKLYAQHRNEVAALMEIDENSKEVHQKISAHRRLVDEIHQLSTFVHDSVMSKRVVGMTTTFAAKNTTINRMLKFGIVIIEEASEVLESHVLVSLTKEAKQVIMIGDHHQLRPLTNNYRLAENFNFNVSLFERLITNNFSYISLDVQRRMKPEICDLVRGTIYKELKDSPTVENLPMVKGMTKSLYWVNHLEPESSTVGETSKENPYEATFMLKLCKYLIKNDNFKKHITILTPYAAQAERIRELLGKSSLSGVRVAVLDSYQGEESEIILLSLVRSRWLKSEPNKAKNDIGFIKNVNRIAVLLSRAKKGLYIVGNMDCLAEASPTWKRIQEILVEKDAIGSAIPNIKM